MAIHEGFEYVVCGHIHQPQMRTIDPEGQCALHELRRLDRTHERVGIRDGKWRLVSTCTAAHWKRWLELAA
jgi:UDP-2,3-diacylglucosamine pyrophosphatase LpxH